MRSVLATLVLALAACSHGGRAEAPAPPDGAVLYRRSCASCHRLLSPEEHGPDTWRAAVERFGKRLRPAEREEILRYLTASSAATRSK